MRRVRVWTVVPVVLGVVALVALFVALAREGPDRTVTGTISTLRTHQVCVADGTGPAACADVDAPGRLAGFAVGDCVRLSASPEGLLVSLDRVTGGCPGP